MQIYWQAPKSCGLKEIVVANFNQEKCVHACMEMRREKYYNNSENNENNDYVLFEKR